MPSKVIGFRVPEDIAVQLEKISEERGMTLAEFMRILVDETLYPASANKNKEKLTNQVQNLSELIDNIGAKIETYEKEGILSPEQVEKMQEVTNLRNQANTWDYKHNNILTVLNENSRKAQDILALVNKNKESSGRMYREFNEKVSLLGSQLETMKAFPLQVERIETDVTRLTTNVSSIQRELKRQPIDETRVVTLEDGSKHTFRVYKSPAGLTKPHVVVRDLILGKKYVDLSEPLN